VGYTIFASGIDPGVSYLSNRDNVYWLRGERRVINSRRIEWSISRGAVEAFILNPDSWVAWRLGDLRDPVWREWVLQAWPTVIPRWVAVSEIARRFGVDQSAVRYWIDSGRLPAMCYQHMHFVDERTLAAFDPREDA
jgi:hypothetical protein